MKHRIHVYKKVGLYRKKKNSFDLIKRGMYVSSIHEEKNHLLSGRSMPSGSKFITLIWHMKPSLNEKNMI